MRSVSANAELRTDSAHSLVRGAGAECHFCFVPARFVPFFKTHCCIYELLYIITIFKKKPRWQTDV